MSLPQRERTVHFYELHFESRTRSKVKNPSCASLVPLLSSFDSMVTNMNLPHPVRQSTKSHIVLSDWAYDSVNKCYILLINKANSELSDVAFRDLPTNGLRKAGKTKTEGIEVSAHAVLRPNPTRRTASLLLTMGAGVAAKDIESLLNNLSRDAEKDPQHKALFYFDDPSGAVDSNGSPIQYKVNYIFAAHAFPGQTLDSALQTGEFESMDLIAYDHGQFDAGGNLQIVERSLSVKAAIPQNVTAAGLKNTLRGFRQNPDGEIYDKLRVRYKTPAGKSTSTTLDLDQLDAAFTFKELIKFDTDVEAQQDKLSPTIVNGIVPLLQSVP